MCIRDSKDCGCTGRYGTGGFVLVIHGNAADQYYHADSVDHYNRYFIPVSYTHLDVYKRQEKCYAHCPVVWIRPWQQS